MATEYFTTTQAAQLLSVSADTVLRWVKSGKIASYRTPGGHARIPREAVLELVQADDTHVDTAPAIGGDATHLFCWDFHSDGEQLSESCCGCPVFQSRSGRCYQMRVDGHDFVSHSLVCPEICDDCEYYRSTRDQSTSVMVVTPSRELRERLDVGTGEADFVLRCVDGAYSCARAVEEVRPDYVVVDCAFGTARTRQICRHLLDDQRLPISRIVLASPQAKLDENCDREVFGWIRKPFTTDDLQDLLDGAGKERIAGA